MYSINAGRLRFEDTDIMLEMLEDELLEAGVLVSEIRALMDPDDFDDHEEFLRYVGRQFDDSIVLDWDDDDSEYNDREDEDVDDE